MAPRVLPRDDEVCPFLISAMADHLFIYPGRAYCHPPTGRVRFPAATTIERICTRPAHRTCPGYRAETLEASALD